MHGCVKLINDIYQINFNANFFLQAYPQRSMLEYMWLIFLASISE